MAWTRGSVVLIPFPHSDLYAVKTRPTIVVSTSAYQTVHGELLLVYLTSQISRPHPTFDYLLVDWKAAGLLKPTLMKPRLAVIQEALIQHHIGMISSLDLAEVDRRLRRAMNLNLSTLDDVLAEVDLTRQPAGSIQRLAEACLSSAVDFAARGDPAIDLTRLRALITAKGSP